MDREVILSNDLDEVFIGTVGEVLSFLDPDIQEKVKAPCWIRELAQFVASEVDSMVSDDVSQHDVYEITIQLR